MPEALPLRSPDLLDRERSLLMLVDLQEKLLPTIDQRERLLWNAGRLLTAANALAVPHIVTEQYPEKLGATVPLANRDEQIRPSISKRMFSCRECHQATSLFRQQGRDQAVLCGIEAHVCILQTALDLITAGWQVFIVADATGSRAVNDLSVALSRLASRGATITTTESALFEWCETSTAAEFKIISALVRQSPPNVAAG